MNYRLMQRLLGTTALYAPDQDDGADFDDAADGGADEGEGEGDDEFEDPDEGDEGDDGEDDGEDPPSGQQQQRQQSRGQTRIQRLNQEAKEARERADRVERENAELRQRQQQGPQRSQEEISAERQRRLDAMTPEARVTYLLDEQARNTQAQLNQIQFNTWDANDKASFSVRAAKTPALAGLEDEVEQRLQAERAQGRNYSREMIATFLLGEKALNRAPRQRAAGKRREQEGREQQGARPVSGRSDRPASGDRRMSEREARRKRLEGQQI